MAILEQEITLTRQQTLWNREHNIRAALEMLVEQVENDARWIRPSGALEATYIALSVSTGDPDMRGALVRLAADVEAPGGWMHPELALKAAHDALGTVERPYPVSESGSP